VRDRAPLRLREALEHCVPGVAPVAGASTSGSAPEGVVPPETVPLEDLSTILDEVLATDKPWLVIVWNDPINLMSYVTFVLQKLFGYSKDKATALMLDVHHKGRAVVSSGTRERAELDVYRLHEHGLWATMEQSL
jgi:ATP-dependent Clp protease adaptor protein ClpS